MKSTAVNDPMMHKHSRNQRIAALYRAGKTCEQIGDQFAMTKQNVYMILRAMQVQMRPRGEQTAKRIRAVYREGMTQREVAEKSGCHLGTVCRHAPALGLKFLRPAPEMLPASIVQAAKRGETCASIARRLGKAHAFVHRMLARQGAITPRPRVRRWKNLPPKIIDRVLALSGRNLSQAEIGMRVGIAQSHVSAILARYK